MDKYLMMNILQKCFLLHISVVDIPSWGEK